MKWTYSAALRLLRASERHAFIGPVGLGLGLFLLVQIVLWKGFGGIPHDLGSVAAVEVLLLLAAGSVPLLLVLVAFGPVFAQVVDISRTAQHPSRIFVGQYLVASLGVMHDQLKSLQSGAGLSLAIAEMDEGAGWMPTFFSSASGKYVGFDSSVPSEYLSRWRGYIRHLEEYEPGVRFRVITSPDDELMADMASRPQAARQLQRIHDDLEADLLCLDEGTVKALAEKRRLPGSIMNLAFWEEDYCLLWERGVDRFTIRLVLAEDPMYARVCDFVSEVEASAVPLVRLIGKHEQGSLPEADPTPL